MSIPDCYVNPPDLHDPIDCPDCDGEGTFECPCLGKDDACERCFGDGRETCFTCKGTRVDDRDASRDEDFD